MSSDLLALHDTAEDEVVERLGAIAVYERFSSRGEADFGDQLLSAMRNEFGGHVEKATSGAR